MTASTRSPRRIAALLMGAGLALLGMGCEPDPGDPDSQGARIWLDDCAACHGPYAQGTDVGPDLTWLAGQITEDEVLEIVLNGRGSMEPPGLDEESAGLVSEFVVNRLLSLE